MIKWKLMKQHNECMIVKELHKHTHFIVCINKNGVNCILFEMLYK